MILKSFWKALIWGVVIFILSSISGDRVDDMNPWSIPHLDKVAHFCMYFLFAVLLLNGYKKIKKERVPRILFTLIITITYGIVMELLQEYVFQKRNMDYYDMLFNSAGILFAILVFPQIQKVKLNRLL